MLWNKCTRISILETVNQGFGFFGSSVYKLIQTRTVLAAGGVSILARHDFMLLVYTFLLLGPIDNNHRLLPPNGWTTIEQANVFITAILWFLEDLFGEVVGGSCFMSHDLNYLRMVFARGELKKAWTIIDTRFFSLMVIQLIRDLWIFLHQWE